MIQRTKPLVRRTAGLFLLVLLIGHYVSITFFPHVHIVNGERIVHSHLYAGGGESNNSGVTHSPKSIVVIQGLSKWLLTTVTLFFLLPLLNRILQNTLVLPVVAGFGQAGGLRLDALRAPPSRMH